MTYPEIVRLLCYTVAAPSALYVALYMARCRQWPQAVFFGSLALSWFWYMAEITIASTGINTRVPDRRHANGDGDGGGAGGDCAQDADGATRND